MKTIYTLLAILSLSMSVQATCRMDTLYQYRFAPGSSVKENDYRTIYTYDALNLETERLQQKWNTGSGTYINFKKYNTSHNADALISSETIALWNTTYGVWDNLSKTNYYYNAAKEITSYQNLIWRSATFAWVLNFQRDYTYNSANNVEEYNLWQYDTSTSTLTNSIRIYYAYDVSQNNIEWLRLRHSTGSGTLVNDVFVSNTFDAVNDNTESIYQIWEAGVWKNSVRYVTNYTATHRPNEIIAQNYSASAWQAYSKSTYTYTSFDSLLLTTYEMWNTSVGGWVNQSRTLYDYNADGLLAEKKTEEYSVALSGWKNYNNETYEYNAEQNLSAKDGYNIWMSAGYYNNHYRDEYICTEMPTSIIEPRAQKNVDIFPNPVINGQVFISVKTEQLYTLTDIGGRVLRSGKLKAGLNEVALKGIVPGFYLVKAGTAVRKIIVQ